MKRIALISAAVLTIFSQDVLAKGSNAPESVPYAVIARCLTLTQRFDDAVAHPPKPENLAAAQKEAAQGSVLCRMSRYEEGGNILAKALKLLGVPAD